MIDLTIVLNPGKESSSMFDVSHIRQPILQTLYGNTCYLQRGYRDAVLAHLQGSMLGLSAFSKLKLQCTLNIPMCRRCLINTQKHNIQEQQYCDPGGHW